MGLVGLGLILGACSGSSSDDTSSTGGASTGGASTGGASTGGASTGGASTGGGAGAGGTNIGGGAGSGGTSVGGGAGSGGTNTGGAAGAGGTSAGGTGGTGGATDGGTGTVCGGKQGKQCAKSEYCDFVPDSCGYADQTGTCEKRPTLCPDSCPGVCGCDGQFYCNSCDAAVAGVDVTGDKSCMDAGASGDAGVGSTCTTDVQCLQGLKCCYPCGQAGCKNQCMKPVNGSCPLFP